MSELKGQAGELRMTVHVTRKATGKVETVELVGALDAEQLAALQAEEKRVHGAAGGGEDLKVNQPQEN